MINEIALSGFFFLFIIITNIASGRYGYETFSKLESEIKLQKIYKNPKKFKIATILILFEHIGIICLALILFLAFNSYSIILAYIWTISRISEASIQIIYKTKYWNLQKIANQYPNETEDEQESLRKLAKHILKTKNTIFYVSQLFFSIGTLSYSILFSNYEVIPIIFGWFGIIASIIYGFGNGIKFFKPNFNSFWGLGGLLILIFELILGFWLLLSPIIT